MTKNIAQSSKSLKLAIIGLGYVGLPLAVEFGKKRSVVGFDIDKNRILNLNNGKDETLEINKAEISRAKFLKFSNNINDLKKTNCYIVTVPTPIKTNKEPNLKYIIESSKIIGKILKYGDIVIYESTVFPGATEDVCVPILEKYSKLKFNRDFFCGYSPERINPGNNLHKLKSICKITSGSNPKVANIIDSLYREVIKAGTYKAENIKVAEAAKVIENTQRDLNIALINELAIIFKKMKIDTEAVINAASTKWNFQKFYPGLVGGHCIGVDPYYLTYKARKIGYKPKIILAGRKLNDSMDSYVVDQFCQEFKRKSIKLRNSKVLILGLTFKENCPDTRNSKIINVIKKLNRLGCVTSAYDPYINSMKKINNFKINIVKKLKTSFYDGIIVAVNHKKFKDFGIKYIKNLGKKNHVLYDFRYSLKNKNIGLKL